MTGLDPLAADHCRVDRRSLRASIETGRRRLDDALSGFDDAAMLDRIDDEWTRKDVIAHLEAWERRAVELLERLRAGDPLADREETDDVNARFFARDRDRSLEDVRAGERVAYQRMLAAIESARDEELFDGNHFSWTEGDPFADWFRGNGDEHYREHLDQLTRPAR
jgi:hypothetical protein